MDFVGHVCSREGVRHDPKKLEDIRDWKKAIMAKGIRSMYELEEKWGFVTNFCDYFFPRQLVF
jgi:hypothetical protein